MLDELFDSLRRQSKRPLLMVVRHPYSEAPAPPHSEDEVCWCNPVIVPGVESGIYTIHHRLFDN